MQILPSRIRSALGRPNNHQGSYHKSRKSASKRAQTLLSNISELYRKLERAETARFTEHRKRFLLYSAISERSTRGPFKSS